MDIPKGFKNTEVGVIPSDWEVKTIEEIVDVDPDNLGSTTNPDYTFKYISLEDVDYGTLRNISEIIFKNAPSRARRKVKKGDILVSTVRPNLKSHLLISDDVNDWVCSTGFSVLRSKGEVITTFLFNYFFASLINRQIENLITGSNYPAINSKQIKSLQIPFPPTKAEQTAIATALNDADTLITELEKLIAKKRAIKQGAMQELLKPKEGWVVKKLGEICNRITTGRLDANAMKPDGEYRFYTCAKDYYLIDKYAFDDEALLISGNGENVGYVHYYKGKFNAYQRTYVLTGFSINSHFIKKYLDRFLAGRIEVEVNAGNTPYIRMGTLTEMDIYYPNDEAEQIHIAHILSDMDAEIEVLEQKLEKYRMVKSGMMQELLTGRIRLNRDK